MAPSTRPRTLLRPRRPARGSAWRAPVAILALLVGLLLGSAPPAWAQVTLTASSSLINFSTGVMNPWPGLSTSGTHVFVLTGMMFDTVIAGSAQDTGLACQKQLMAGVPCSYVVIKYRSSWTATPVYRAAKWLYTYNGTTYGSLDSPTQITVSVNDAYLTQPGVLDLYVMDALTGTTQGIASVPIVNPVPVLDPTTPLSVPTYRAGQSSAYSGYVNGTGLTANSVVLWNGATGIATTTWTTQAAVGCTLPCLGITVPSSYVANPGTVTITVYNADPLGNGGGGTSNPATLTLTNPLPSVVSLTPNYVAKGSTDLQLQLNGTNFVSGATVQFDGTTYTPSSVTPTTMLVTIPQAQFATPRSLLVGLTNPPPGGGPGAAVAFNVVDIVPTVTTLSPLSALVGGAGFTLTVNGSSFDQATATVTWGGTPLVTQWVSLSQVKATVPAGNLGAAGTVPIGVQNTLSSVTYKSNTVSFSVQNPAPTITGLTPSSLGAGSSAQWVTITGTNFVNGASVTWGAVTKSGSTVSVVSPTALSVSLTAQDLATAGTVAVSVTNPSPGGGTSPPTTFSITNAVPTLTSLSPASALAGSQTLSLTVSGTGFVSGSQILWAGSALPTTVTNASTLTATIPTSSLTTASNVSVTVTTPAPGGGTSNALSFQILPPVTIQTGALQPAGNAVEVQVSWNGTPTSGSVTCGQGTVLAMLPGICTYTAAGTYTLSGSFVLNETNFTAPAVQLVVPSLTPALGAFVPTVNNQAATGTVQVYSLPAQLAVPLAFSVPSGVGILDTLDLSRSRVVISLSGQQPQSWPLQAVTADNLTYALKNSSGGTTEPLAAGGTYTVTLNGYLATSGQPVTASATFTVNANPVALSVGTPTGQGIVTVSVSWPSGFPGTALSVTCGTPGTPQTFAGPSGVCLYTTGGTFPITATFTDPTGDAGLQTSPASVTIPWRSLQAAPLVPQINGASQTQLYSLPATLTVPLALSLADGDGIFDPLDVANAKLVIAQTGQPTRYASFTPGTDPLHFTATATLQTAGTYTLSLTAQTLNGKLPIAATPVAVTLTLTTVQLQLDPEAWDSAQQAVTVLVHWPTLTPAIGNPQTDCGTSPAQKLAGSTVQCVFTKPGTFTVSGTFTDPYGNPNIPTSTTSVSVASIPVQLDPAHPFAPVVDGTPVTAPLTVYSSPLPVTFPVSLVPTSPVGFADTLDLTASSIQVTKDGLALPPLSLTQQDRLTFQAKTSLTASGAYTFTLLAKTTSGQLLAATASLALSIPPLTLTLDPPVQQVLNTRVAVGVHWPGAPVTNQTVTCGPGGPTFTGTDGVCVYTKPGTYTVTGTFTDTRNVPSVATAPATTTISALVPTATSLAPTVNGQPATTVQLYSFPAAADVPVVLTVAIGVGILDELDLAASTVQRARNGGTPTPLPTLARTDGLHYDASDALTQSGTYTFRLQGVTLTGKTVATDSTPLVLALTPLMLIAGDQIPQGPAVAVPISWPDHPVVTDMVTDCGTSVPQHFSGASGTCVYTKAGAFTVTGKFTDPTGTPNASTAPLAVSIQTLALAQATLVPMVGGQPLAAAPIYGLPVSVTVPLTLTAAPGVGITDTLNLSTSKITVMKDGASLARLLLTSTDALDYTATLSVRATGTYTFVLDGHTNAGATVSTTVTVPVALNTVTLQADAPVQDGPNVSVTVHWPAGAPAGNVSVKCGTPGALPIPGVAPVCTYSRAGSYQVSGSFTDPTTNKSVSATPLPITVASLPPVGTQIALTLNGQSTAIGVVSTTLPAVLNATISLAPSPAVGILDPVFKQTATLTLTRPQASPLVFPMALSDDGSTLTAQQLLNATGDYHVAFAARTLGNAPLTGATDFSLSGAPITLQLGSPTQVDPQHVAVPVSFPDTLLGSKFLVDCGSHLSQVLSGQAVTCTYTQPGTYQVLGYFMPQGTTTRAQTESAAVTIPAIPPPYLNVNVTVLSGGQQSEEDGSAPDARSYHLAPTSYPVDLKVVVNQPALQDPTVVGLPALLDPAAGGKLTLTLLAGGDDQPLATPPSTTLGVPFDDTSQAFKLQTTLRGFALNGGTPHLAGTYRLTFTAKLADGTPLSQSAMLRVDEPALQAQGLLYGVIGPYTPSTYNYRVTVLQLPVTHDRISTNWTATSLDDPSAPPVKSTSGSTNFTVTFATAGHYRVILSVSGTVSGSYTWSDDVTVLDPPAGAPYITISSGGAQRPPVQYLLRTVVPAGVIPDGDRITTTTFAMDGVQISHPWNRVTVTTPDQHTIAGTINTAGGLQLTAAQLINVLPNMVPQGIPINGNSIDCSKTLIAVGSATLRCLASGVDPDGRIVIRHWVVPELKIDLNGGWSLKVPVTNPPPTATVHLYITDDSGATVDLGPVPVTLQPSPSGS